MNRLFISVFFCMSLLLSGELMASEQPLIKHREFTFQVQKTASPGPNTDVLNSSLVLTDTRDLSKVATYGAGQLAVQYTALMLMQPPNWQAHGNSLTPSWAKFTSNFQRAPVWSPHTMGGGGFKGYLQADGDSWVTNVVGHGLQGSEIYLRMRQEGFNPGHAFLAGAIHSTMWEYAIEGWNETPSLWDLVYTPIGGIILGELRYFLLERLDRQASTAVVEVATFVLDPFSFAF